MSFGPTEGTLFGLAWGDRANKQEFERERERLREQLKEATTNALGEQAMKDAAKAVLNAVVRELQAEAEGKLPVRRLSDPANRVGRAGAFMDTAEGQLRRLSEGQLGFTESSINIVKNGRHEVSEVLKDPLVKPTVTRRK